MLAYLRFLAGRERSEQANRHVGLTLAFVAGAVNAGGFLALARYTSHVTGVLSEVADDLVLGQLHLALTGASLWAAFVAGGAACAVLVNWARRRRLRSEYALALVLESLLLLGFALTGGRPLGVQMLSFVMGLQNAAITKLSGSEIRTTHMTGNTTDLGIELGKLFYWNRTAGREPVRADRAKLKLYGALVVLFLLGGVSGGLAFKHLGALAALPLSALLMVIAAGPVIDDVLTR